MRKRMVWWREAKWLIASYFFVWAMALIGNEMTAGTAATLHRLFSNLDPDPKWQTVTMRLQRKPE